MQTMSCEISNTQKFYEIFQKTMRKMYEHLWNFMTIVLKFPFSGWQSCPTVLAGIAAFLLSSYGQPNINQSAFYAI